MVVEKKIVIFLLAISLTNLLISVDGACVQRDNVQEVSANMETKSDTYSKSQCDPSVKFKEPQKIAKHPEPNQPTLYNRNNFGDFLEMCGKDQVMIEGRCEYITL